MRPRLPGWAVAAWLAGAPAVSAEPVQAWIEASPAGEGQSFRAHVRTAAALAGRYELVASRQGPSGRSSTRQAGSIELPAGGEQRLSQLSLSPLGPQDRWEVVLRVFESDCQVAEDRMATPDGG